jgi:hypothetical protein
MNDTVTFLHTVVYPFRVIDHRTCDYTGRPLTADVSLTRRALAVFNISLVLRGIYPYSYRRSDASNKSAGG